VLIDLLRQYPILIFVLIFAVLFGFAKFWEEEDRNAELHHKHRREHPEYGTWSTRTRD
jgi:hypothetical protein